jgi:hypothetical protein
MTSDSMNLTMSARLRATPLGRMGSSAAGVMVVSRQLTHETARIRAVHLFVRPTGATRRGSALEQSPMAGGWVCTEDIGTFVS